MQASISCDYHAITIFSDMSGYQRAECSQKRHTTQRPTASLNDNTRSDLNSTTGGTQDTNCNPVKQAQSREMNSGQEHMSDLQHDDDIAAHGSRHVSEKPSSSVAREKARKETTVSKHSRTHKGDKRYPCSDCGKSFTTQIYLSLHIRHVHENHKRFYCNKCGKSFFYETTISQT